MSMAPSKMQEPTWTHARAGRARVQDPGIGTNEGEDGTQHPLEERQESIMAGECEITPATDEAARDAVAQD